MAAPRQLGRPGRQCCSTNAEGVHFRRCRFQLSPRPTDIFSRLMSLIWFVLPFALSTGVSQDEPLDFSCATFHAYLSESELIASYGRESVTAGPVFGSDDGPSEGTILFA